jgi:lipopolysaccharide transport system ATP-binding protein
MGRKVISVENVWKQYRLGTVGTGMLGQDLKRWWYKSLGKEDPFSTITEVNDRNVKGSSNWVWALQDISFSLSEGEVLGVVGRNGAGKSTLLKLLSRVTAPTRGEIRLKGRIASLLEVGTGFHPELTGRENIFLNGAILGMRKSEIQARFDEIVAFSGVERYIDTPVKRYSSGMYIRLAFAVAAHLDPEIMIVDEVLAVGDLEFQKKCLGKMKDVSGQGRTILFVSHNLAAIRNLCTRAILLEKGQLMYSGGIEDTISAYLRLTDPPAASTGQVSWTPGDAPGGKEMELRSIRLLNPAGEAAGTFFTNAPVQVEVVYSVKEEISGARIVFQLKDNSGLVIFNSTNHSTDSGRKTPGLYRTVCTIPANLLNKGRFQVVIHVGIPGVKVLVQGKNFLGFNTVLMGNQGSTFTEEWAGVVAPALQWETQKI